MITADMFDSFLTEAKVKHFQVGHIDVDGCYGRMIAGWVVL